MILKQKGTTFTVLDIGNSKVVCIIATYNKAMQNKIIIKGIGYNACSGTNASVITDMEQLSNSIVNAVEAAESKAGEKVHAMYVNVSANNLLLQKHSDEITIIGREINDKDTSKLMLNILDKYQEQPLEILHTFIYNYTIDGHNGILNPLGLYANSLAWELYVLSAPSNFILNMTKCITNSGNAIEGYIASTHATSIAVISEEEKKMGVTMLEFSAGITTVTVFDNGNMIYTDSIPLGGIHVTNDIAKCLDISVTDAERLKVLYGSTILTDLESNKVIELKPKEKAESAQVDEDVAMNQNDESDDECYENVTSISCKLLIEIIRARIEEILSLIKLNLEANKVRIRGSMVITGGGAKMNGMQELVNHFFLNKVRMGYIRNECKKNVVTTEQLGKGYDDSNSTNGKYADNTGEYDHHSVEFATSVGMMCHIVNTINNEQDKVQKSGFRAILDWLKKIIQ